MGRAPLILRDRSDTLPRWAVDGGNGSVVSVGLMDDNLYEAAWTRLQNVLKALPDFEISVSDFLSIMAALDPEA